MKCKQHYGRMIVIYLLVFCFMIGSAFIATNSITVIAENAPLVNRKTIVIDAGHGGIDGGATSCSGILESKTNLQIALRLRDVCHLLGIKTVMIRTEDVSVYTSGNTIASKKVSDLKERVRIVNENKNCLLISIHQNYFSDSKYSGAQVFYSNNPTAKTLSATMQNTLVQKLNPDSNRKAKKAEGIYLMKHIQSPGLLIECGFISNIEEDILLQSKEYQQKLCIVIGCVLSSYLNT